MAPSAAVPPKPNTHKYVKDESLSSKGLRYDNDKIGNIYKLDLK